MPSGTKYRPNHNLGSPNDHAFYVGQIQLLPWYEVALGESRGVAIGFLNTDGPFVQSEGRSTRPATDIPKTVQALAILREQSPEKAATQIISNLRDLVSS